MDNAVTRRLALLQDHWDDFREMPQARICRWVVPQDAYALVDAFYQVSADESSDTPDIFLRFESIFTTAVEFGKAIAQELSEMVEADREDLAGEGIDIPWRLDASFAASNTAASFLRNFFHFTLSLDLDEDELMVAFIAPLTIQDRREWQKWWADVAMLELPPQIRLMVCDVFEDRQLDALAQKNTEKITTIKPQLDAVGMMRELMTEYGDQNDSCTHFRKAYFELCQCAGQKDLTGIQRHLANAMQLAQKIGYPHLEITALCAAANGFVAAGQLDKGLQIFDNARLVAKAAEPLPIIKEMPELKMDLPGGNIFAQLGVQTLFFKGAALVGAGRYEQAAETYILADADIQRALAESNKGTNDQTDWTNGGILLFHRMEALRMAGFCLEKRNKTEEAVQKYEESVNISKKMDNDTRKNTTVAFSAASLLRIYRSQGKKKAYMEAEENFKQLLGPNWQESLPKQP